MTFTLVKVEDGGEYEVRASNEMGSAMTKTTVVVQSKCPDFSGRVTARAGFQVTSVKGK